MLSGERLKAYQATNRERTVTKIRDAMSLIEDEVASEGFYPHRGGRISRNEVCRRAGVGTSTLKNKTHAKTASEVDEWLKRLSRTAPTSSKATGKAKSARISDLLKMIDAIAANYDCFKVEHDALAERNAELEAINAQLRSRIGDLELEVTVRASGPTVVPFERSR